MDSHPAWSLPYAGPEAWRRPIEAALCRVVDPEIAMNIVDVGLVQEVVVTADRWHVAMTMTSAACPMTELILEEVEAELGRIAPDGTVVEVELVWDPAWSADRMSPRAKEFMGW